jgi:uncharacterized protein (TIGR02246 family)
MLVFVAACSPNSPGTNTRAPDPAASQQQVRAAADRIWAAVARTDAAAALAEYDDDAILLGPGTPMVQGKPAITKVITDTFAAVTFRDVKGSITDITVSEDLGIETGTYAWTVVAGNGSPMPDKGKYIHVWRRSSDGAWKVIRYIINSDLPPQ